MSYLSNIIFIPIKQKGNGHFGFIQFTLDNKFAIKDVAVYRRRNSPSFRLVYPEVETLIEGEKRSVIFPINKETQESVEREINEYLRGRGIKPEEG